MCYHDWQKMSHRLHILCIADSPYCINEHALNIKIIHKRWLFDSGICFSLFSFNSSMFCHHWCETSTGIHLNVILIYNVRRLKVELLNWCNIVDECNEECCLPEDMYKLIWILQKFRESNINGTFLWFDSMADVYVLSVIPIVWHKLGNM